MGYTVSTGKLAAAFVRGDGEIVYVLFEKTHESNVYPQTPHWSCIAIGTYAEVMLRVFRHATSCEGGMLKGSGNRDIKPENYITGWRHELAEPVLMDDLNITLTEGGKYSPEVEKRDEAIAVLRQMGRNDLVDAISNDGKATIGLYRDVDVVLALYGVDKLFSPWRVLKHADWRTMRRPELGAVARVEDIQPPMVRVLTASCGHRNELFVQLDNGPWQQWGADYSALGEYLLKVAYPYEMKQTGCHKRLIAEFRDLCATALDVPDDTKLKLFREAEGVNNWNRENFDRLVVKLGGAAGTTELDCTFGELKAVENGTYDLTFLLKNQVVCDVQSTPTQPVSQLSLLAA